MNIYTKILHCDEGSYHEASTTLKITGYKKNAVSAAQVAASSAQIATAQISDAVPIKRKLKV